MKQLMRKPPETSRFARLLEYPATVVLGFWWWLRRAPAVERPAVGLEQSAAIEPTEE
jgi:hypothetical protein